MRVKFFATLLAVLIVLGAGSMTPSAEAQGRGGRGGRGGGPGGRGGGAPAADLSTIRLPPGFRISMYTDAVPAARSMVRGDNGTIFVGTFGQLTQQGNPGVVYAVRDTDNDGTADEVLTIAEGLNQPNGVAFHDGDLFVAEMQRILRYDDIESRLTNPPEPVVIRDGFLDAGNHQWRYIEFGPDGKLYMGVGAPCNICEPDEGYGSIIRMNPDGSGYEIYATGIRNSVGLAFHPGNGELWFTDNGRDMLGDNVPSDELNHVTAAGQNFGFPYCHQGDVPDPELGSPNVCDRYRRPEVKMGPHVAALGLDFYEGDMFPAEYQGELFIAQHGSWNRSNPLGYRIVLVHINDGISAAGQRIFAEGWLQGNQAWGRPSDVIDLPDGSLLVSDDLQGNIYRITYEP